MELRGVDPVQKHRYFNVYVHSYTIWFFRFTLAIQPASCFASLIRLFFIFQTEEVSVSHFLFETPASHMGNARPDRFKAAIKLL